MNPDPPGLNVQEISRVARICPEKHLRVPSVPAWPAHGPILSAQTQTLMHRDDRKMDRHFLVCQCSGRCEPARQCWDFSAFKTIRFYDRVNMHVRDDAFNAFNHTKPVASEPHVHQPALW